MFFIIVELIVRLTLPVEGSVCLIIVRYWFVLRTLGRERNMKLVAMTVNPTVALTACDSGEPDDGGHQAAIWDQVG